VDSKKENDENDENEKNDEIGLYANQHTENTENTESNLPVDKYADADEGEKDINFNLHKNERFD